MTSGAALLVVLILHWMSHGHGTSLLSSEDQRAGLVKDRPCAALIPVSDAADAPSVQLFLVAFALFVELLDGSLFGPLVSRLEGISQLIVDHADRNIALCPAAVGLAYLLRAEKILLALLPLASLETPREIIEGPCTEVVDLIGMAMDMVRRPPHDEGGATQLLKGAIDRVEDLLRAVRLAGMEPWFGPPRTWVQDPRLWKDFCRFGRVTLVPLAPTPWDFEIRFGAERKPLRGASEEAVHDGWREIKESMDNAAGVGTEWWPIMGTLIGLLRYGRLHGRLSDGKVDLVDDDIDLLVVIPSADAWLAFCLKLTKLLRQVGWLGCAHALQLRYHNNTQRLAGAGADLRGLAILICARIGHLADVILNVYWVLPVEAHQPVHSQAADCPRAVSRGPRAPTCGARVRIAEVHAVAAADITEEVLCMSGGGCWSVSAFFGHWPGAVLPARLRQPAGRCEAWGQPAVCPHAAAHIAQHWNNGEYWRPPAVGSVYDGWPCLALPDIACPDPSALGESLAWHIDRQPSEPRNVRLREEGLSRDDIAVLRMERRRLQNRGFLAHNFTGCNWTRCSRSASIHAIGIPALS